MSGDEAHTIDFNPNAKVKPLSLRRQVISLSGGGYRGLFTARILEHIEQTYQTPVRDRFNLIVGTSVGALIAAALAHGISAARIREAFETQGKKIFNRGLSTPLKRLISTPYNVDGLNLTLNALFDPDKAILDKPLNSQSLRLLVTAVGIRSSRTQVLGGKGLGDNTNSKITLRGAILASAAAPTFFPAYYPPKGEPLVDGGLVANAPELVALAYGRKHLGCTMENLYTMSIGTAAPDPSHTTSGNLSRGILKWLLSTKRGLVQLTLNSQEELAVRLVRMLAGDHYLRVDHLPSPEQAKDVELDRSDDKATTALLDLAERCFDEFSQKPEFKAFFL